MSRGEFDLIRDYFRNATGQRGDVALGIGDDCALLDVPDGKQLAISMDTLVVGRHFVSDVDPESLGHKALAVNLSDLAAMGAKPAWVTLGITLPNADEDWLQWLDAFMRGFSQLANQYQVQLVGGDTTRGTLTITVQVHGFVEKGQALRRDAAQEGDFIYVSGTIGDAGLALLAQQDKKQKIDDLALVQTRLDRPSPRVELGLQLLNFAKAAIDLSDGLVADLQHICSSSEVSARIFAEKLPLNSEVERHVRELGDWTLPLSAGDDYELIFTVDKEHKVAFEHAAKTWNVPTTWIGNIESSQLGDQVKVVLPDGQVADEVGNGYDHFST